MNTDIKKCVARAIVNYLDGNVGEFKKLSNKATEMYKKDRHLYVSVEEILKAKGEVA